MAADIADHMRSDSASGCCIGMAANSPSQIFMFARLCVPKRASLPYG